MKKLCRVKPYLFVLPMLFFALGFVYYPFLRTFMYSLTTVNFKGEITGFAGFDNYAYLFSRRDFSVALKNTLLLTCVNTPVTVLITLAMAAVTQNRRHTGSIPEWLFSLPMAVSMSAAAMLFKSLLHPSVGLVNRYLGLSIGWFEEKRTAMPALLLLTVWMGLGFNYLLLLASIRGVPRSLNEAARVDGAGAFICFFRVQLPQLLPTLFYVLCTNMTLALLTSGPVILITSGGPARATTTLIYMMYSSGYGSSNYSLAGCVSMFTFVLAFVLACGTFAAEKRRASE